MDLLISTVKSIASFVMILFWQCDLQAVNPTVIIDPLISLMMLLNSSYTRRVMMVKRDINSLAQPNASFQLSVTDCILC